MGKNKTKQNKVRFKFLKRRQPNRSRVGDFFIYLFLLLVAVAMVFPLVFAINSALKPLDELFMFPPKVFAQNPTLDNFSDLFVNEAERVRTRTYAPHRPGACFQRRERGDGGGAEVAD